MERHITSLAKDFNTGLSQCLKQLEAIANPERMRKMRSAAEDGQAQAQYDLGKALVGGELGKADKECGREWLAKAAVQGHVGAEALLASELLADASPETHGQAIDWLRRAAESGHVESQHALALRFSAGDGVERDAAEAARWHTLAAESGHPISQVRPALSRPPACLPASRLPACLPARLPAQFMLAEALMHGEGLPQSPMEAERWLERSKMSGFAPAAYQLEALNGPAAPAQPSGASAAAESSEGSAGSPEKDASRGKAEASATTPEKDASRGKAEGAAKKGKGTNPAALMLSAMRKTFKIPHHNAAPAAAAAPAVEGASPAEQLSPEPEEEAAPAAAAVGKPPPQPVVRAPKLVHACYELLAGALAHAAEAAGFALGFSVHVTAAVLNKIPAPF